MKQFLAFVRKEFYHIFRDKRTLIILFGQPISLLMLFGFALTNEIKDAGIAIYDQSGDDMSVQLKGKLLSSGYFREVGELNNFDEIEESFKTGDVKLALIIAPDFGNRLKSHKSAAIQLIGDASDPNIATTLIAYAESIIRDFQKETQTTGIEIRGGAAAIPRMVYNPEQKPVFMFVPGVMALILMLVSAMMTSITIAREKELGTMAILMISPLKPVQIILGKVTPYLLLSLINGVVIVMMGIFVFGMPVKGSLILLFLEVLLFIITALGLGIFISSRSNSQMTAMFVSMIGLMMPTILLSGFIFPIENMPLFLQGISNIMPARWFIIIIKNVMLKGSGLSVVLYPTLVLLFMAVAFLVLSIKNINQRLN